MKEKKVLKMCKIVHKITLIIGLAVTVLPILFWSYIPNKIPAHYGATGKADRIGNKEELILLFFVLWLLIGIFSIVSYYLKASGVSKYASEQDEENLHIVYPMMTWTSFVVVCNICLHNYHFDFGKKFRSFISADNICCGYFFLLVFI